MTLGALVGIGKRIARPLWGTTTEKCVGSRNEAAARRLHKGPLSHRSEPMPAPLPAPPPMTDEMVGAPISLFLDFDGTLVDIADRHDAIAVDARVRWLMAALAKRLDGRLAVVSGRPAAEICAYLHAEDSVPPFAIAGSHGLELCWTDGRHEAPLRPAGLDEMVAALRTFALGWPGVVVEDKPFGAALHYRLAPQAGPACDALADRLARRYGFTLQLGKMVCELRSHGADKGDAVRRFLAEPPMAGTPPLFVGDDLTDEAGFAAAEQLGGVGILVGAARETVARYGLPDVAAVHR